MASSRLFRHWRRTTGSSRVNIIVFTGLVLLSAGLFFTVTLPKLQQQNSQNQPAGTEAETAMDGGNATPAIPIPRPAPVSPIRLGDPALQMEALAKGVMAGRPEVFLEVLGPEAVTPRALDTLAELLGAGGYEIDPAKPVSELARQANLQRWALNLRRRDKLDDKAAIELDFARQADGSWMPQGLRLPGDGQSPAGEIIADGKAIDVALAFVNAVIKQDFQAARKLVDSARVTDTSIAGLCILFEEGAFVLKKEKPLLATVAREDVAWFLAMVTSATSSEESRFGMVLQREPTKPWTITEINLDRLLAAYASRFGEGSAHYTPLVRNPKGGDSIVLYFAYDSGELGERTLRQLRIVMNVLQADAGRKLKISGHTDAHGSENYNFGLSRTRAEAVLKVLLEWGLPEDQISVEGFGASMPRQENTNPDGSDNPLGRQVNRRAEIFLDF